VQSIKQYQAQLQELSQKRAQAVQDASERWSAVVNQVSEISITAKKSDVYVQVFGVAWQPYYIIRGGGDLYELPAFGAE
jgi:hypothetical protein